MQAEIQPEQPSVLLIAPVTKQIHRQILVPRNAVNILLVQLEPMIALFPSAVRTAKVLHPAFKCNCHRVGLSLAADAHPDNDNRDDQAAKARRDKPPFGADSILPLSLLDLQ